MVCFVVERGKGRRKGGSRTYGESFFVLFCFSEIGPKYTETLNMSGQKWYSWQPQQIT